MQRRVFAALIGLATLSGGAMAAFASGAADRIPGYIAAAVADPARPQADRDRDAARKPADMLVFMGIKPGQRVVDFMPGYPSYFTGMFADAVGPKGVVYAFIPSELAARVKQPLPASGAHIDPNHPNVIALVSPVDHFATPQKVDIVWTSQNYHDLHDPFMGPADMAVFDKAVFDALKPGGVFVILDHAAQDGSGVRDTNTLHRIDTADLPGEVSVAKD